MRLEQVPEVQDRRLIGDRVAAEFKMAERAHRLDVVERFLGTRIGQVIPLLQTVDAQHHGDRKWSAGRRSNQLSDNVAQSKLPAPPTAPPPSSRLGIRPASCASSCLQSPATQSSADHPSAHLRINSTSVPPSDD